MASFMAAHLPAVRHLMTKTKAHETKNRLAVTTIGATKIKATKPSAIAQAMTRATAILPSGRMSKCKPFATFLAQWQTFELPPPAL